MSTFPGLPVTTYLSPTLSLSWWQFWEFGEWWNQFFHNDAEGNAIIYPLMFTVPRALRVTFGATCWIICFTFTFSIVTAFRQFWTRLDETWWRGWPAARAKRGRRRKPSILGKEIRVRVIQGGFLTGPAAKSQSAKKSWSKPGLVEYRPSYICAIEPKIDFFVLG